jgi:hypothetical protein
MFAGWRWICCDVASAVWTRFQRDRRLDGREKYSDVLTTEGSEESIHGIVFAERSKEVGNVCGGATAVAGGDAANVREDMPIKRAGRGEIRIR